MSPNDLSLSRLHADEPSRRSRPPKLIGASCRSLLAGDFSSLIASKLAPATAWIRYRRNYAVGFVGRGRLTPLLILLVAALVVRLSAAPGAIAVHTTDIVGTEYKVDPVGIDVAQPRLTWQLRSEQRGTVQMAYQVQVTATSDALLAGRDLIWDSGRVDSDRSVQVAYAGPMLKSGQRYHWRVRTWDGAGHVSAWSQPAYWEMGLLQPSDWSPAAWITPAWDEDTTKSNPAPMFRKPSASTVRCGPPALCDQPRTLRSGAQRPASRRPALHARVDQLRPPAPISDLRRHGAVTGRRQRFGYYPRQRAGIAAR